MKKIKTYGLIIAWTLLLGFFVIVILPKFKVFNPKKGDQREYYRLINQSQAKQSYRKWLGEAPYFNSIYHHYKKRSDDSKAFDVYYKMGAQGERLNDYKKGSSSHLLLFGGSNTFGEGVAHNDDLGAQLQLQLPHYHLRNFSYRGHGANHALAFCEQTSWDQKIKEKRGIFLYHHFYYHLYRFFGEDPYLRWSKGYAPYYRYYKKDDRFHYQGLFNHSWKIKIKGFYLSHPWFQPRVRKVKNASHKQYFLNLTKNKIRLYAKALGQLKACYLEKFPAGHFIIALSPFGHPHFEDVLKIALKRENIDFWHWKEIMGPQYKQEDGHLNKEGHNKIAQLIAKRIGK